MNKVGVNAEMTADELLINCFQIWRGSNGCEMREAANVSSTDYMTTLDSSPVIARDPDLHWLTQMSDSKSVTNDSFEQSSESEGLHG